MLLKLRLTKPQRSHILNFMEGLLICEGNKTLSTINRLLLEPLHPSSMADFFIYSPWDDDHVRNQFQKVLIRWATEDKQANLFKPIILISIDDSLSKKPKESKHFEPVGWHFDASEGKAYGHGVSFVTMHLQYGNRSVPINWRIYLKEETVRRLNCQYTQKISFKSKMMLAMEILKEIQPLLPKGYVVYVLFDSWYASNKLITFCRKNNWHVICALKSNRRFQRKRLSRVACYVRHRDLTRVLVDSANTSTLYWTCLKRGKLKGVTSEVDVIISKRHPRDKRPEFFLCTDASLSVKKALGLYTKRWAIEADYLYLKSRLGLGDFRLRSMEGINRYFTLTFLTLAYLSWRKAEEGIDTLSDVIAVHRQEQYEKMLRAFDRRVLEEQSVESALNSFLPKVALLLSLIVSLNSFLRSEDISIFKEQLKKYLLVQILSNFAKLQYNY
jgi:hypothetical protein